ncbi:MAG: branched-chain amino acid ABC transporter permease [Burkholderiales bacterium]|nr:MAG: branched-chain amino acid ABC transporter permease [Burkholderiales bacterium]
MKFLHPDSRPAFMDGARETLIIVPSYLPFALVCGVAAVNAGLVLPAALALPGLVYGGSSQAVLTQFLQSASALWVAVLSGLVVNLRMAVYSAAMAPRVRHLSTPRRMLAAAFLVDNAFALMQQRELERPKESSNHLLAYYAGVSAVLWPAWLAFCIIGSLAGSVIPASWQLDFAIPLAFIATLSTTVRSMPLLAAAVAGAVASVALFALPLKLGMIAACLLGLLAGLIVERLMPDALEEKNA